MTQNIVQPVLYIALLLSSHANDNNYHSDGTTPGRLAHSSHLFRGWYNHGICCVHLLKPKIDSPSWHGNLKHKVKLTSDLLIGSACISIVRASETTELSKIGGGRLHLLEAIDNKIGS